MIQVTSLILNEEIENFDKTINETILKLENNNHKVLEIKILESFDEPVALIFFECNCGFKHNFKPENLKDLV